MTFWQAGFKLLASAPAEAAQLPADAATAVAGLSHLILRDARVLPEPWVYRATWEDGLGAHEVSTLARCDLALVQTAIALRQAHPDAATLLDTRNLLITNGHLPWLKPYHLPARV
jgi:hypothetical protein